MGFLLSRFEIDLDIFDELRSVVRNGRIHQIQVGIYLLLKNLMTNTLLGSGTVVPHLRYSKGIHFWL